MIYYKTKEEIELIRESSLLVSKTLAEVAGHIKPGVKTGELDKIAEEFIRDHDGVPAFKNYNGFPKSLCISVNEEVVHGIPGRYVVKEKDVLSVDCGVLKNSFFGDSAYSFAVGDVDADVEKLLVTTLESLYRGIEKAVAGNRLGDIGYAIQHYAEAEHGYGLVRELVGHGIGKSLHEDPEVPNYGRRGTGVKLKEGLVLAIEPMVNLGVRGIRQADDGWTIITRDKAPAAHYEHTVAVGKESADVLSSFEIIEERVKKNKELKEIIRNK